MAAAWHQRVIQMCHALKLTYKDMLPLQAASIWRSSGMRAEHHICLLQLFCST